MINIEVNTENRAVGRAKMQHSKILFSLLMTAAFTVNGQIAAARRIEVKDYVHKPSIQAPKDLWVLSQRTDGLNTYTVCVAKGAVKFISGHLSVIARQPDWQVTIVNENAKTYWQMPFKEFHGLSGMETFDVKKLEKTTALPKDDSDSKIAKQSVIAFTGVPDSSPERIKKLGFTPAKITIWSTSDIKLEPDALAFFSRLYKVEGLTGIPMRVTMKPERGEDIECLVTDWCLNREQPSEFFEVPKLFRKGEDRLTVENEKAITTTRSLQPKTPKSFDQRASAEKDPKGRKPKETKATQKPLQ